MPSQEQRILASIMSNSGSICSIVCLKCTPDILLSPRGETKHAPPGFSISSLVTLENVYQVKLQLDVYNQEEWKHRYACSCTIWA